jgi:hypothetical protein
MAQEFESIGSIALLYLAQWTGVEPSSGEIQLQTSALNAGDIVRVSKFGIDGIKCPVFGVLKVGDDLCFSSLDNRSKFFRIHIGSISDFDQYVEITLESTSEITTLAAGQKMIMTRMEPKVPFAVLPSDVIPWDNILTDGFDVLVNSDGNVLTS